MHEISRNKHKNPNNNLLKSKYHEKLKELKTKCKSKRYQFWQTKLNEIENAANDPKSFWKKWKKMNEIDVNPIEPNITGEECYNHFSILHNENYDENAILLENYNTKDYNTEFDQPF